MNIYKLSLSFVIHRRSKMYCNFCGGFMPQGQDVCPNCGAYVGNVQQSYYNSNNYGQNYYNNMNNGNYRQNNYNSMNYDNCSQHNYNNANNCNYSQNNYGNMSNDSYGSNNYSNTNNNNYNNAQNRVQPVLGMKWYNFLIWCDLFLIALYNFVNGIRYITGSFYGGNAEYVYSYFSELKSYDVCVGILAILFAIFAIITRFRLSGYKKNGPSMFLVYAVLGIIFPIVAYTIRYSILSNYLEGTINVSGLLENILLLIGEILIMIYSAIYFKQRKHLFVN